ncbi:MAG: signal peptidase I [Oscillospiraceae bacterium]|nr:signal peptidase I [Oscillospiraceae bacterium]
MGLFDWIQCIVTAILCGILIFVFIGRIIGVDGSSMVPTLENGDRVILSNLFFTPKYGDIVVLKTDNPLFEDHPLVKRVIATAGQTLDIDFDKGEVIVDGYVIEEPYIAALTHEEEDFRGEITIPEGYVFVMGDNRNKSTDSRSDAVGLVDTRQILGKVYWVIIPGVDSDRNRDWHRIGSVYN